jgi:uncharacterized protein YjbK
VRTSKIEYEVKLDLGNKEQYTRLISSLGAPKKVIAQSNYFFDSSDSQLLKAELALRLRISSATAAGESESSDTAETTAEITLKGPQEGTGELSARSEISAELPSAVATAAVAGGFDLTTLELAPIIEMRRTIGVGKLIPLVSFSNKRMLFEPETDIGCLFEVDLTTFADKSARYELEMEFVEPNEEKIAVATDYVREMLQKLNIAYQPQPMSKFGLALSKGSLLK